MCLDTRECKQCWSGIFSGALEAAPATRAGQIFIRRLWSPYRIRLLVLLRWQTEDARRPWNLRPRFRMARPRVGLHIASIPCFKFVHTAPSPGISIGFHCDGKTGPMEAHWRSLSPGASTSTLDIAGRKLLHPRNTPRLQKTVLLANSQQSNEGLRGKAKGMSAAQRNDSFYR